MDTPDISLTSFRLCSTLECVFSQQQMHNRQEQMLHSKRKGLYEIKFIEFSRIGFLWDWVFYQICSSSAVPSCWDTQLWGLGLLNNQKWLMWDKHMASKTQHWPSKWWQALWGQRVCFQAFSERVLSVPLLCRQTTAHWHCLPPTFLSGCFAGAS